MKATKKTVSLIALESRMRRHLEREGYILRKCKQNSRWYSDQGDYYTTDMNNAIRDTHINLEAWARESGILRPFEEVA